MILVLVIILLRLNFNQVLNEYAINTAIQSAQKYSFAISQFRTLYTSEVVERIRKHKVQVTHDYIEKEGAIPLPATLSIKLGNQLTKTEHSGKMRLYSAYPFPWRQKDGGPKDQFERDALKFLSRHPDEPFIRVESSQNKRILRYAIADRMRSSCVSCHNTHSMSPKTDWKIGDLRGVLSVTNEVPPINQVVQANNEFKTFALMVILLVIVFSVFILVLRYINKQEQTVIKYTQSLEKEIQQRKAAEKELLDSNQELERFAYVASHDLQEPLRMVSGYLGLLKNRYKEKLDKDANQFIDFAVGGAQRMSQMISLLLQYSKIGKEKENFSQVNVNRLVERVIHNLEVKISESSASVNFQGLPEVICDAGLIERLFQNLISNAIKFVPKDKEPKVNIDFSETEDKYIFSVADNGIGISKEDFHSVFEIFTRLETPGEYDGSGIGLAICKQIVQAHHGSIWVESTKNQGTTFFFSISKELTTTQSQEPKVA